MQKILKNFTQLDFDSLVRDAAQDDDILGFFFGGSRGKSFEDEYSDWDLRYVVRNGTKQKYSKSPVSKEFERSDYENMEFQIFEYDEFVEHALWKKDKAWDRYSFAHVHAYVDKTGDIQKLIDDKSQIPKEEQQAFVTKEIDAYIHSLYRSVKAARRGDILGSRIEAGFSMHHLLAGLFATEYRTTPYPSYLSHELHKYPLLHFPLKSNALIELLEKIVGTGDITAQQELARTVETYMQSFDFYSYDRWAEKYAWALKYEASEHGQN